MLFTNITELIQRIRFELGNIQQPYTDSDIQNFIDTALIIHNKLLKGYNTESVETDYQNGIITIDPTKEVVGLYYADSNGNYVYLDKTNFNIVKDQLQISLPNYVTTVEVLYNKPFTIDNMTSDIIQLAFVYLVCDLVVKKRANPNLGIQAISDGIMNIKYDSSQLNSPDNSKYMKLYFTLIYKESSYKSD